MNFQEKNIRIGQGVTMGKNISIGFNTIIMDSSSIGDNAAIGNNCILYPQTIIEKGVTIQDNVILGKQPKSLSTSTFQLHERGKTIIGAGSLICAATIVYAGTTIWKKNILGDNVIVREGCVFGENVKIGKGSIVEFDVQMGNNVAVQTMSLIAEKSVLEDFVFIGPNVSMALDKYMARKGNPLDPVRIRRGAAIGANCLLLPGVDIGENVLVGAGSIIHKSLEGNFVYMGNPLRKLRAVNEDEIKK